MRLVTKYKTIFFHPRDADANRYFGYITTPLSTRMKWVISDLVKQLKSDGNWLLLDRLWLFANENQQSSQVSLVNPSSTQITEVNSPTWTQYQGYTGNGTSMYLNSNYNPATQGVNYTQNSACIGVYSRSDVAETKTDIGTYNMGGSLKLTRMVIRSITTNLMYVGLNTTTNNNIANTNATTGLYSGARTSSSLTTYYRNGSSLGTDAATSTTPDSGNMFILAMNNNGTVASLSTKQLAMAFIGAGSINQSNLYTRIQNYMTRLGTQV